jgi:hypothetical protein
MNARKKMHKISAHDRMLDLFCAFLRVYVRILRLKTHLPNPLNCPTTYCDIRMESRGWPTISLTLFHAKAVAVK